MAFDKNGTLFFEEVDLEAIDHYVVETYRDGELIGAAQVIPKDDAVDGYDEVAGEMELRLGTLEALGDDARGVFAFKVYSYGNGGRSETALDVEGIEIDFLPLPPPPSYGGVR